MDEVAAQHVDADAMIHYGYACMTKCVFLFVQRAWGQCPFFRDRTSRLPVIYVFGKKEIDPDRCVASILEFFKVQTGSLDGTERPTTVILRHDVAYTHRASTLVSSRNSRLISPSVGSGDMHEKFKSAFEPLEISVLYNTIPTSSKPRNSSSSQSSSEQSQYPPPDVQLENSSSSVSDTSSHEFPISKNVATVYIGGESLGLTNLLMTNGLSDVCYRVATFHPHPHSSLQGILLQPPHRRNSARIFTNQ